jgi:hypothetical protein
MLDASFWMLDWAASFDFCRLTSTLGVGRSAFAFATARQVSACHADSSRRSFSEDGSLGVGGLDLEFSANYLANWRK